MKRRLIITVIHTTWAVGYITSSKCDFNNLIIARYVSPPAAWPEECVSQMCDKQNTFHRVNYLQFNLYLKFSPPSAIMCCSPPFNPETNLFKWLTSSTFHNSSSVYLSKGSKFRRRVPENNTGSCKNKIFRRRAITRIYWVQTRCCYS